MEDFDEKKPYVFTNCFLMNLKERIGINPNEDVLAYLKAYLSKATPHRKIDNKGRPSEYFTLRLDGNLITIVADPRYHKVITVIKETHNRKKFASL